MKDIHSTYVDIKDFKMQTDAFTEQFDEIDRLLSMNQKDTDKLF